MIAEPTGLLPAMSVGTLVMIVSTLSVAWSAVGLMRLRHIHRRTLREVHAEVERLRCKMHEFERQMRRRVDKMQSEVDARLAWYEAGIRVLEQDLGMICAGRRQRSGVESRGCIADRRRTHRRESANHSWRPRRTGSPSLHHGRQGCR